MYLGVPVLQLVGFIKHGHMPRDPQHVFNVAPAPVSAIVKNWQLASTSHRSCKELAIGKNAPGKITGKTQYWM